MKTYIDTEFCGRFYGRAYSIENCSLFVAKINRGRIFSKRLGWHNYKELILIEYWGA